MSENLIGEKARRVLWLAMAVVVAWIAFAISYPDLRNGTIYTPLNNRWSDHPQQSERLPQQPDHPKTPPDGTGVLKRFGNEQNEQIAVVVKEKSRSAEQKHRARTH